MNNKKNIIIIILSILILIVSIISFLNSEFYWNKIRLRNINENCRIIEGVKFNHFETTCRLKYYPQTETFAGKFMFDFSKEPKYFYTLKRMLELNERFNDENENQKYSFGIKFLNSDNFTVKERDLDLDLAESQKQFIAETTINISKKEMKNIKSVKIYSFSRAFDYDTNGKDYKFTADIVKTADKLNY